MTLVQEISLHAHQEPLEIPLRERLSKIVRHAHPVSIVLEIVWVHPQAFVIPVITAQ